MRPTIDEQLTGASRLLRLAEREPSPEQVVELVRNARRLVDRVAGSWSAALPFLEADNTRTATLLDTDVPTSDGALAATAARNEELRAALVHRIRDLPAGPERRAIGAHLRERVALDPT